MVLTRVVGLTEAGIFTIAYANANLFLTIGNFGMRYFQVSDVRERFSFCTYRKSRIITTVAMMILAVIYVLFSANANNYSPEKTAVIIFMCLFKAADAYEDIYWGRYQQKGRLDIGSKCLALRTVAAIVVYIAGVIAFRNQLVTLIVVNAVSYALMFLFIKMTKDGFTDGERSEKSGTVTELLKATLPLFLGAFLSFYIGNAPKYAIDAHLSDDLQACYGFIAMPVFVIGLLNNFIFNPVIHKLSIMWDEKKYKGFVKRLFIQMGIIAAITLVCMVGAYLIGIPVLSLLYGTDLRPYKFELILLLLGGGFLALAGCINTFIIIIRHQNGIAVSYGIIAALALVLSNPVVRDYGIRGAAYLYAVLMLGVCICFSFIVIFGIRKEIKNADFC